MKKTATPRKKLKSAHPQRPREVKQVPPRCDETRDASPAQFKELRTFPVDEIRVVREEGKPTRLVGYAAVFGSPSVPMKTSAGKTFREVIAPGAFRNAIASDHDLPLLVAHDPNKIIARTGAKKLSLREDAKGLAFEAELPDTQLARDLAADVDHGNVRGMSFGFSNPKDEWSKGEDGTPIRTLIDIPAGEISATGYPAYPATNIGVRSIDIAIERIDRGEPAGTAEERCGGYGYSDSGGGIRSACRSAQMSCRDAHDAMENALHTLSTRKNDPNEHELRAVRDMMTHVRDMSGKSRELRDAVKGLDGGEDVAGTGDLSDLDEPPQPGGATTATDGPRDEKPGIVEKAMKLGIPAAIVRSVLPKPANRDAAAKEAGTQA